MIGANLKEIRKRKRFTVTALAVESGVSRPSIWKIENSKASPRLSTLEKLANALGVTIAELCPSEAHEKGTL